MGLSRECGREGGCVGGRVSWREGGREGGRGCQWEGGLMRVGVGVQGCRSTRGDERSGRLIRLNTKVTLPLSLRFVVA